MLSVYKLERMLYEEWRHEMKYRVHKLDMNTAGDQVKLEQFINNLEGDVISIVPNIARTSLLQIYGLSRKVDYLLVVEKI